MATQPPPAVMATQPPPSNGTSTNTTWEGDADTDAVRYRVVLLFIYTVVLLSGMLGMVLTVRLLQSNNRSLTTIAVLNLIFAHFLFLVTLPFRIYYYAVGRWDLGAGWCRAVSSMIHIHLYMSFIFYVVILFTRLYTFHRQAAQVEFHRKIHPLLGSLATWAVVAVAVPCVVHFYYGKPNPDLWPPGERNDTCFKFGNHARAAAKLNYVVSLVIIAVSVVLTGLQAHVLLLLHRKYGRGWRGQQVFWAQLKSLCFAGIMVVCFVPYHMYRLYYIASMDGQNNINEVFLSLTAFSCLDMLTFVGKGTCVRCYK